MTDDARPPIVDPSGKPARPAPERTTCPQCHTLCPPGDDRKRTRSGSFGAGIHDVCLTCGYEFLGELTV